MEVTEEDVREAMETLDPRVFELLTKLTAKLLIEQPSDAYESLEQLVTSLKETDDSVDQTHEVNTLQAQLVQSLARSDDEEVQKLDDVWMDKATEVMPWTDCREQLNLLRRYAGICIPEDTVFLLSLSMRRLQQMFANIFHLRFWGCIAYKWYVLEAELTPQGFAARAEEIKEAAKAAEEEAKLAWEKNKKEAEEKGETPPEPVEFPLPEVPSEPSGTGVNSLVYLVSDKPGLPDSWIWLPDLSPEEITLAREILHFPSDLDDTLDCSALSPAQFMRAQIARINASTRVAPRDLFRMRKKLAPGEVDEEDEDEDEEEEEEEEGDEEEPKEARANSRFKAPPLKQLLDQDKWVHTMPHILQEQARVKWWNPNPDAEEDEDKDEDEDGPKKPGPEKGPKPLTPIGQDKANPELVEGFPTCWALRRASVLGPPAVVVRSLIWPGSISVFSAGRLEHVYVGWGVKTSSRHFCPKLVPELMAEPTELILAKDPTLQEEKDAEATAQGSGGEEEEED